MMVMMPVPRAGDGAEDRHHSNIVDALTLQHLTHGTVIRHTNDLRGDLDGEVEVSHQPGAASRDRDICSQRDFENRLRLLLDDIMFRSLHVDEISMGKEMIQIETNLFAVLGYRSPAALGQGFPQRADGHYIGTLAGMNMEVMMDNLHEKLEEEISLRHG